MCGLVPAARAAAPEPLAPLAILTASDGVAGDHLGSAVALSGDTVVIGAPDAGAAYVFARHGGRWEQQAKLLPSATSPSFGASVAISGNTIAVGTPAQSVEVFVRSEAGWTRQAVLTSPSGPTPGAPTPNLGYQVAISGDVLVTSGMMGGRWWTGWVFVFERTADSWGPAIQLDAPGFDNAVAVSRGTVVARDRMGGRQIRVYTRGDGSWPAQANLAPEDGVDFAAGPAFDGDRILTFASAASADASTYDAIAYLYQRRAGAWTRTVAMRQTSPLTDDPNVWGAWISGRLPVVGTWWDADGRGTLAALEPIGRPPAPAPGRWTLTGLPARSADDGYPVTAVGDQIVAVGAPWSSNQAGAVHLFQRPR
jgi:hypothetical protein